MFVGFEGSSQSFTAQCLSHTGEAVVGRNLDEKPVSPIGVDDERLDISNSHKRTSESRSDFEHGTRCSQSNEQGVRIGTLRSH